MGWKTTNGEIWKASSRRMEDPRMERTKLHRLRDIIVTIDAIGTQTKIAEQIIEQEGEYAPVPAP